MSKKVALAAALAAALISNSALAGTATTTMPVTATITGTCTATGNTLNFGSIVTIIGVDTDVSATVDVTCTNLLPYNIGINDGLHAGVAVHARNMDNAGTSLGYQIYKDALRTVVVDAPGGTNVIGGTGSGAVQNVNIYGRIPQQLATPASGTYTDTLNVTVTY